MTDAREAAFYSLERCEKQKKYSSLEIDSAIKKFSLEGAEKNLYVSLVYGVTERLLTLDFIIGTLSSRGVDKTDLSVLIPLRLGLYQMIFMDKIPPSAAVDTSVELTKKFANRAAANYTNAILRSFLRAVGQNQTLEKVFEAAPFAAKFSALDKYEKMSVIYSYPAWLCKHFAESYGENNAVQILSALNGKGRLTLRVNTLKISRDKLIEKLDSRGVRAEKTAFSPFGVDILNSSAAALSDLIDCGEVFVQDEASQIAVCALAPASGDNMLDSCACPGGKSFSSAILMNNRGKIISCDLHKSKLSLIESGAEKLGIDIIDTVEADSSKQNKDIKSTFPDGADKVLCDVPCSGLGVIAKKPEIRYKKEEDIRRLPEVQLKILKNCADYVKHGGVLVYSTCTLNPDENENNVRKFLEDFPEFSPCDFEICSSSGEALKSSGGMLTLFPHINRTDGFFVAKMIRSQKSGQPERL